MSSGELDAWQRAEFARLCGTIRRLRHAFYHDGNYVRERKPLTQIEKEFNAADIETYLKEADQIRILFANEVERQDRALDAHGALWGPPTQGLADLLYNPGPLSLEMQTDLFMVDYVRGFMRGLEGAYTSQTNRKDRIEGICRYIKSLDEARDREDCLLEKGKLGSAPSDESQMDGDTEVEFTDWTDLYHWNGQGWGMGFVDAGFVGPNLNQVWAKSCQNVEAGSTIVGNVNFLEKRNTANLLTISDEGTEATGPCSVLGSGSLRSQNIPNIWKGPDLGRASKEVELDQNNGKSINEEHKTRQSGIFPDDLASLRIENVLDLTTKTPKNISNHIIETSLLDVKQNDRQKRVRLKHGRNREKDCLDRELNVPTDPNIPLRDDTSSPRLISGDHIESHVQNKELTNTSPIQKLRRKEMATDNQMTISGRTTKTEQDDDHLENEDRCRWMVNRKSADVPEKSEGHIDSLLLKAMRKVEMPVTEDHFARTVGRS